MDSNLCVLMRLHWVKNLVFIDRLIIVSRLINMPTGTNLFSIRVNECIISKRKSYKSGIRNGIDLNFEIARPERPLYIDLEM